MWKRNVACLRSCSSIVWHGRGLRAHELFGTALQAHRHVSRRPIHIQPELVKDDSPIREEEFLAALREIWPWETLQPKPHTMGIAASGGVDSMALATLYANSEAFKRKELPDIHGFVIDHKVRPESTEEAKWVAEQLSKLGCQTSIIPIEWPEQFDINSGKFEAEARIRRYQALGIACRYHGIKSLMVAHHADDQVETFLMRLIRGRLRSGLRGMESVGWIPECYGIHGVHHSSIATSYEHIHRGHNNSLSSQFEHGGIQIFRPLLGFRKNRLIATCEAYKMPWTEDKTNQDPTLTMRNAVRHIIKSHQLPAALSTESLLSASQTVKSRLQKHQTEAERLFNASPVQLDIQTASLHVDLPLANALFTTPGDLSTRSASEKHQARNTAYLFLERIANLVTPKERNSVESLANSVLLIWPALAPSPDHEPRNSFCTSGLWWRQSKTARRRSKFGKPVPSNKWIISREPQRLHERDVGTLWFPPSEGKMSKWHFFDGRFWVRVRNLADRPLVLRLINDEELEKVRSNQPIPGIDDARRDALRAALAGIRLHSLRRYLPALFHVPGPTLEHARESKETLVALPTLQSCAGLSPAAERELGCTWEVRYKKIDTGTRALEDIVVPPRWDASVDAFRDELVARGAKDWQGRFARKMMNWARHGPRKRKDAGLGEHRVGEKKGGGGKKEGGGKKRTDKSSFTKELERMSGLVRRAGFRE